jgi:hypothetical protein
MGRIVSDYAFRKRETGKRLSKNGYWRQSERGEQNLREQMRGYVRLTLLLVIVRLSIAVRFWFVKQQNDAISDKN